MARREAPRAGNGTCTTYNDAPPGAPSPRPVRGTEERLRRTRRRQEYGRSRLPEEILPEEIMRAARYDVFMSPARHHGRDPYSTIAGHPVYPQELNDIPQIVARKREGAEFADMIIDAFEALQAESERRQLVMGIALHPYIAGQPHRFKHLKRALEHIKRSAGEKVWFATSGAIAAHAAALPEGMVP